MISVYGLNESELDGYNYFFSPSMNSVLRRREDSFEAEYVIQFDDSTYCEEGNYMTLSALKGSVWCFPSSFNYVSNYNLKSKKVIRLELKGKGTYKYKFFSSIIVNNYVVGIPGRYDAIVVVDTIENKLIEIPINLHQLYGEKAFNGIHFSKSFYVYNNIIFLGTISANYVVMLDLKELKIFYKEMDKDSCKEIIAITGFGDKLYVIGDEGKVLLYKIEGREINYISSFTGDNFDIKRNAYTTCVYWNQGIFISNVVQDTILFLNPDNGDTKIIKMDISNSCESNDYYGCIGVLFFKVMSEDELIVFNSKSNCFWGIDASLNITENRKITIEREEINKIKLCRFSEENSVSSLQSLNNFISAVMEENFID